MFSFRSVLMFYSFCFVLDCRIMTLFSFFMFLLGLGLWLVVGNTGLNYSGSRFCLLMLLQGSGKKNSVACR